MIRGPNKPILVFDVNETLLDLGSLDPIFERVFGDGRVMRDWFNQVILYSEALSLTEQYVNFASLGGAVLKMTARIRDVPLVDEDIADVKAGMASLSPHADTAESLDRLKAGGFRMVTLTNNPADVCEAQLEQAGIRAPFEALFSIDGAVKLYKPALASYRMVADALGVPLDQMCMIACHTWDTLGASAAGMMSALILRTGNAPMMIGRQPDLVGGSLREIADRLLELWPKERDLSAS